MCLPDSRKVAFFIGVLSVAITGPALAGGIVLGIGAEGDNSDGRAYSLFADFGVTDNTWLSAAVARNETNGDSVEFQTQFADFSFDHFFEPLGIRLGGSYWGDEDLLESKDAHASLYLRGKKGSISVDYEHRNFDLTIGGDALSGPRSVDFSADGFGVTGRFKISAKTSVYLGGMSYDYSRPIALTPESDRLRFLGVSRISLMNSLIDYRASGGIEIEFGERRLDVSFSSWETAVFQGHVDSLGVGWLMPLGKSADIEFRLASDNSDEFGRATVFSVFLYWYKE